MTQHPAAERRQTGLPFDDVRQLLDLFEPAAEKSVEAARARLAASGRRKGTHGGRLDALGLFLAGWRGTPEPELRRPIIVLFAASHQSVLRLDSTALARASEAAGAISSGTAVVTAVAGTHELGLKVFDLALAMPTPDMSAEPAMEEAGCAATIAFGMEALADGPDLLGLDVVAPGGALPALALIAALTPLKGEALGEAEALYGPEGRQIIEAALALHDKHLNDPLEALRRLGGRDLSALFGALLAARLQRVPVMLGGLAALGAACVLKALKDDGLAHALVADSADAFEAALIAHLGLAQPVSSLGARLDDGVSLAEAMGTVRAASAALCAARPRA